MATATFNFPTTDLGTKSSAGADDTIQLSIVFTLIDTGGGVPSNVTITTSDYNLKILSYGDTEYRFDLDTFIATSGKTNFKIFDPDGILTPYLFDVGVKKGTDIEGAITLQYNGVDEFGGRIVGDSSEFDTATKIVSFEARPNVDLLNSAALEDDDSNKLDPLGYGLTGLIQVEQLIEDIYDYAVSGVTTDFAIQWRWFDDQTPATQYAFAGLYVPKADIVNGTFGGTNLFELLSEFAKQFYAMTGLLEDGTAFFKNMFYYDTGNVQTVDADDLLEFIKGYSYSPVDYVTINPSGSYKLGTFTNVSAKRFDLGQSGTKGITQEMVDVTGAHDTAYFAINPDREFEITSINTGTDTFTYFDKSLLGLVNDNDIQINTTGTMPGGVSADTNYFIISATATTFQISTSVGGGAVTITSEGTGTITYSESLAHTYELANSWYDRRHTYQSTRIDTFEMYGLNYDFIPNFIYDGKQYQIVELKKHWEKGTTTIKALVIGDSA